MRNWINLTEALTIPQDIVEEYSNGKCMWLALAMNRRYGWPIYSQMERDLQHGDYIAHAYCVMPNGKEIDILGPQDRVDLFAHDVEPMTPEQLYSFIHMTPEQSAPMLAAADKIIDLYIAPSIID